MSLTAKDADKLLAAELEWAKRLRRNLPFSQFDRFPMRISIVDTDGVKTRLPIDWTTREEQFQATHFISRLAAGMKACAVMLATDTTILNATRVALYLGITVPIDEETFAQFNVEYGAYFRSTMFDRELRNLPASLWDRAIMVALKSPLIPARGLSAIYTEDKYDQVLFSPDNPRLQPLDCQMGVIDDWWTIPETDPLFRRVNLSLRIAAISPQMANAG